MSSICIAYQRELYAQGIEDYLKKRDPSCKIEIKWTDLQTQIEANSFDHIYVVNHESGNANKTFGPEGKFRSFDTFTTHSSDQENAQKICVVYTNHPSDHQDDYFNGLYKKNLVNHKVHAIAIDFKNLDHKDHAALLKKYFTFGRNEGEAMWKTVLRIVSWITLLIPLIVGGLILYFHCTTIDAEVRYNHDNSWTHWPKKEAKSGFGLPC
ncbi:MAG: hypothetical protein K940chlam9_01726 [Chlamydiae bacterium]|nr:hypothetical protein [Chlamydiota bacterium]